MVEAKEGKSINLTVEILSDSPLTFGPTWSKLDEPLPSKAVVRNFFVGRNLYTSFGLSDLSFANDTGNYSLTTENECGESNLAVYIDVKGI